MSCPEILDELPLLVYDELDADRVAACRRHLADCPTCRAELAALERTRGLLDRAPEHQSQLDLAAVCLRIAARERRGRSSRRVAYGASALAATIAVVLALRFLNLDVEPGRLVVAWTPRQEHPAPTIPAIKGEPSPASQLASDNKQAPDHALALPRRTYDATPPSDGLEGMAILDLRLRRAYSPGQAEALRYAKPLHQQAAPATPTTNYNDLRRELLGPTPGVPDA